MELNTEGAISPALLALQFAVRLPVIVVLVVGLSLLMLRRAALAGRGGGLAVSGCVVMLVAVALGILWSASFPALAAADFSANQIGIASTVVNGVITVLDAIGLGLLIAGLVVLARHLTAQRQAQPGKQVSVE